MARKRGQEEEGEEEEESDDDDDDEDKIDAEMRRRQRIRRPTAPVHAPAKPFPRASLLARARRRGRRGLQAPSAACM